MKKFNKVLVVLSLVFVMLFAFAACGEQVNPNVNVTVVLQPATGDAVEYAVNTKDIKEYENPYSIFEYLEETKELKLSATYTTGVGHFFNSFGVLQPDASKYQYIWIMTSVEKDFGDVNAPEYPAMQKEYKGTKLVDSNVGIDSMTLEEGTIIYLEIR